MDKQPVKKPDPPAKAASSPNMAAPIPIPNVNSILSLQGLIGNHAVRRRMIQRANEGADAAPKPKPAAPDPLKINLTPEQYEKCYAIFKSKPSWSDLKKIYIEESGDLQTMAELWAFRRKYVVDLLLTLRAGKYANLLGKSAGSTDLSSDYDITIASPGNDNDVKAIEDFNNAVKADFSVQPGTVFDTNLYAKDFLPVNQSSEFEGGGTPDSAQQPIASIVDVENDTQDVGALLKQRRYMTQAEWDKFVNDLVKSIAADKRAAVKRKYDEADATYQICVATLLQELRGDVAAEQQNADLEAAQENNAEELHAATEENSDKVLEKSNQLYLGRMSMIRSIQANIAALESKQASLSSIESISEGFSSFFNKLFSKPDKSLNAQIEAQKAQIKQLLSEAIYFAAEAYTSEGAIKHVVAGIQGNKLDDREKALPKDQQAAILAEKRKAANDKLTMSEILQSFNEQLGDFLKDFGHLSHASPGTLYIKSSKYVDRMLDALLILQERRLVTFPEKLGIEGAMKNTKLATIVTKIKELLAARKDPNLWEDKREERSVGIMAELGITDVESYKSVLLSLGVEINALVRNNMTAGADSQQELTYMQNRNTAFD